MDQVSWDTVWATVAIVIVALVVIIGVASALGEPLEKQIRRHVNESIRKESWAKYSPSYNDESREWEYRSILSNYGYRISRLEQRNKQSDEYKRAHAAMTADDV